MGSKKMPEDMAGTRGERVATKFSEEKLSPSEVEGRRKARLKRVSAFNLDRHELQPEQRDSPEAVEELKVSIQELGLLEPPLVWEETDGTRTILAGHRRVMAWKLSAAEGACGVMMRVYVLTGITEGDAFRIMAAEYLHRQEYSLLHTTEIVGNAYRQLEDEHGKNPSRRAVAATLPLGKSSVDHYLTIFEALQDPRLKPLVHSVDRSSKTLIYKILSQDEFSDRIRGLEVLRDKGSKEARRILPSANGGPSEKAFIRKKVTGGREYVLRLLTSMDVEELDEVREAAIRIAETARRLRARVES